MDSTSLKKCIFEPSWCSHNFSDDNFNSNKKNIVFIIPNNQQNTKQFLQAEFPTTPIFSLSNETTIASIIDDIKSNSPHIIFISQSTWSDGADPQLYSLFLNFIQKLGKVHQEISIDIVMHSALSNPFKKHIMHPLDAVYIGLGQTIQKELANLKLRVFDVDVVNTTNINRILYYNFTRDYDSPVHITEDSYHLRYLSTAHVKQSKQTGFKKNGTYLIIGGNGGIGSALADFLIKKYNATLILVGRKLPNQEQKLRFKVSSVHFEAVDFTSAQEVEELFSRYNKIDGIVHSALILEDASILNMTATQLNTVIAPKVIGTVNLINAIRNRRLDFVLFFSSIQSFIANAGQANYTAACVAKDSLAYLMHDAFMINSKIINWGYWGSIGIVANDFYRQRMKNLQIDSIEVDEGMSIIEMMLESDIRQIAVVKGSKEALKRLNITQNEVAMHQSTHPTLLKQYNPMDPIILRNRASMHLLGEYVNFLAGTINLPKIILPRFEKLRQAIDAMKKHPALDKNIILKDYPELKPYINLIDKCVTNLLQIVKGEVDPLSILFPNGSFELVEPIYRNNPIADYYNKQVSAAVVQFIQHKMENSNEPIRILEIGSGTGSTSLFVIPAIAHFPVKYHYTDVSRAFLIKANRQFQAFPFINYEIFNVEEPYEQKDYFDIVIATNVIHATSNVPKVLSNVYDLLKPQGIFILNEITECQDFATLTFGLTDGWWLSSDAYRLPNSPLLNVQTWENLLKAAHFEQVDTHGGNGQHIILSHAGAKQNKDATPKIAFNENQDNSSQSSINTSAKTWLKELIASVMLMSPNDFQDDTPFNEYGIDSLIALELITPMNKKLGYVPATILFEYPTIKQLSDYIAAEFKEHFEQNTATNSIVTQSEVDVDKRVITKKIKSIIAEAIQCDSNELNNDIPLSEYGIDSLISLEILVPMRDEFGYLPATLLFEYPTIDALTHYFSEKNQNKSSLAIETPPPIMEEVVHKSIALSQKNNKEIANQDIAIIGIAGQFPQAQNIDELWAILQQGKSTFVNIPSDRWNMLKNDKIYTHIGSFIDNIGAFDHVFFNITPLEAEKIDPQERLFLQTTYHAIQDAGIQVESLSGQDVGCYVGVMNHGYSWLTLNDEEQGKPSSLFWSIANRASYIFNWKGPSFAVDSACSSSLTALHNAILGLQYHDCETAIVGGVNLISHPRQYEDLCQLHMLSPRGTCKPFSADSDGIVDGEGIISIVLKRHQDAVRDQNYIYGIIRGSSVNSGGKANGYTAPNPEAQSRLIGKALARANLQPCDIGYIEAHGTGTELGDPIEIRGLTKVFESSIKQSIPIGSIKGNIGHLESAAGLASVVKVLLQFKYNKLVPSIGCKTENPHLNINKSTMHINTVLKEWPHDLPKRACVSSFGAGGANAHVVIEAYEHADKLSQEEKCYIIPLSAHSETALQNEINNLREFIAREDVDISRISYGYCQIRSPLAFRTGFVVRTKTDLIAQLQSSLQQLRKKDDRKVEHNISADINRFVIDNQQDPVLANRILAAYIQGHAIEFERLFDHKIFSQLPHYAFDKHTHWVDAKETKFKSDDNIITQHNIRGKNMAPASYIFSHLIEENDANCFESVVWKNIITDLKNVSLTIDKNQFKMKDQQSNIVFSEGVIKKQNLEPFLVKVEETNKGKMLLHQSIYRYFEDMGYNYKGDFRAIKWAIVQNDKIYSQIELNQTSRFKLSPALIDAALQSAILSRMNESVSHTTIMVPYYLEKICIFSIPINTPVYCTCYIKNQHNPKISSYDIELSDVKGNILIALHGVTSIKASIENIQSKLGQHKPNFIEYQLN